VRLMRRGKSLHRHLGVVSSSSPPSPSSSLLSDLSLPSFSYLTSPLTSPSHLVTHLVSPCLSLSPSCLVPFVPHLVSRLSSCLPCASSPLHSCPPCALSPSHLIPLHLVSPPLSPLSLAPRHSSRLSSSLLISLMPHLLCALSCLSSPLLSPSCLVPSPLRMGTGTPAGANMIHHTHTCIHHTPHRYGDTGCGFVLRCLIVHHGSDTTCTLPWCLHILIAPAAQQ
jgi:hypothetical protein